MRIIKNEIKNMPSVGFNCHWGQRDCRKSWVYHDGTFFIIFDHYWCEGRKCKDSDVGQTLYLHTGNKGQSPR